MGCGESKHAVIENTISRKNSKAGSERGKSSQGIEETRKVDSEVSSSVQQEGKNDGLDIVGVASGTTSISRRNSRARSKKGKSSETIEESKKVDGETSSMVQQKEVKNDNRDTDGNNSGTVVDGKKVAESIELKKGDKTMAEETKEKIMEEIKLVEETKDGEAKTMKKENLVQRSKTITSTTTTEAKVSTLVEKQEEKPAGVEDLKKK
ncbi:hypothetical protein ERO13_A10G101000v2 [Gossypium hirsutum]|uniref:Uncharacterized protein n=3 Tax=Gossypium TaxID=3633 RepID=A0A1U8IF14_GOSHI|nr:uncharacterized protein LOC107896133 [Gossypium hirsutum]KAG4179382.1 hypothetical protein ERO13_A10G101000v2 [Gossypium hirsutum]TYG98475.1 hypothetical protein ES288_A10G119800v1 [Gossypium darwinii]TYI05876.1 hypothetical protein ES332_A10G119200v1 [Gossypium tomentosum]